MQYLLLIYGDEANWANMPEETASAMIAAYGTFSKEIEASGHLRGGEALQPVHTATTVRVRDGKTMMSDGPFAETREQLGGYYLIEAKDIDEAVKIAAKIPDATLGCVEVRPIMKYGP
ncbi:MAG: YciI family protein [Kofleriaceae bacterium]